MGRKPQASDLSKTFSLASYDDIHMDLIQVEKNKTKSTSSFSKLSKYLFAQKGLLFLCCVLIFVANSGQLIIPNFIGFIITDMNKRDEDAIHARCEQLVIVVAVNYFSPLYSLDYFY